LGILRMCCQSQRVREATARVALREAEGRGAIVEFLSPPHVLSIARYAYCLDTSMPLMPEERDTRTFDIDRLEASDIHNTHQQSFDQLRGCVRSGFLLVCVLWSQVRSCHVQPHRRSDYLHIMWIYVISRVVILAIAALT
jgi:hypothetical protein